jgi:hypothetical protein
MVERSLPLRCVSQVDAAELIRPYLDRSSSVVLPPASHFLRVRAFPAQIDRIQSVLQEAERTAPSCAAR